jgi:hypothetical protein
MTMIMVTSETRFLHLINESRRLPTWRTGLLPVAEARASLPPCAPTHSIVLRFKCSQLARRTTTSQWTAQFRARQDSNTHSYKYESFQPRSVGYCFAHRSWCSFAGCTKVDHCCQSFKQQNHSCVTISIHTFFLILFLKYKPYPTMV